MELDDKVHELKLGRSFDHNAPVAFHSVRYDFKPASVDTTQKSIVEIGQGNSVTVSVPHVEGAGTTHTVYKGNKRPSQKECVLIIDHTTGEMTLEKLANTIQLKKTRQEGSSRVQQMARPVTPVEMHKHKGKKKVQKHAPPPPEPNQSQSSPPPKNKLLQNPHLADAEKEPYSPGDMLMSASSGDSGNSSSSDSDMDLDDNSASEKAPPHPVRPAPTNGIHSMLSEDLQLSESGSDSD
ncbi:hypothetical protein NP493_254g03040 [Ridgeia piscesae]|uniref:Transcription elongation factor Eaf N-terminal domain-containing protein n=1 Tax=Ridgeia piscesae TaxID=27915 RepID=A0AAD9UCW3_RIDPI|nr:hypothetical protein NP493_254g03040 [Ridgeia piscesae]